MTPKVSYDAQGFANYDASDYHVLADEAGYIASQKLSEATTKALANYLDPNPEPGTLYNKSQNMNYALAHGTMNAKQQAMYDGLIDGMHNLGENLTLTRYDHGGAIDQMIKDITGNSLSHSGMSIGDLKDLLVGGTYSDSRILSTSCNDFANSKNPKTFNTREIKITYKAKANTQGLATGVGAKPMKGSGMKTGDNFGEVLLGPTNGSQNSYKIVDVKYSGNKARPKGAPVSHLTLNQIEVVVEVG